MKIQVAQRAGRRASLYRTVSGARAVLLLIALAGSSLLSAGGIAHADSDAPSTLELKQMSLEELLDIKVTSVARHPESLLQADPGFEQSPLLKRAVTRRLELTSIS